MQKTDHMLSAEVSSYGEGKLLPIGGGGRVVCSEMPLDVEGVREVMNREMMEDECRVEYLGRVIKYWRSRGMDVERLREMVEDCNRELERDVEAQRRSIVWKRRRMENEQMERDLELEGWKLDDDLAYEKRRRVLMHQIELAKLTAELKRQREMGVGVNLAPMDCNEKRGVEEGEFTNIHFYLKKELPEIRMLIGDMDERLKQQGYLKTGGDNSIKGALGCITKNDKVRRVVWTGKLVELNALINYLMDEVQVIGCTSGYNNRWKTTAACFVDKDGGEINVNSLSRSSNISWEDRDRLLKCVPKMG